MKWLKNVPFLGKMIILGVLPLMVLGIVIGVLSYQQANNVVKQSEKEILGDTINRIDINITGKARQLDGIADTMASSFQEDVWTAGGEVNVCNESQHTFFDNMTRSVSEIGAAYVILGERVVYRSGGAAGLPDVVRLAEMRSAAEQNPNRVFWTELTSSLYVGKAEPVILAYRSILNSRREAAGLIILELDPISLGSALLTKQKVSNYQTTFLADRRGNIIYSDNSIDHSWLGDVMERYGEGARRFTLDAERESYYVCTQYNALTNWVTYTVIPEKNLFPAAQTLRHGITILVAVATGLALLFPLLLSSSVIKPLKRLKDGMRETQDANFKLRLENDRKDEIGDLTDSFNSMVERINTLVNQVYQGRLAQKNAEIEALQAQINPHFLYNTLDSINWMLIDRGEMDVSRIVVALGKLMQYTMDTANSMVTLEEEYRNAQDYLMIQKNRLEDRLECQLELEPGLEKFLVPKLILQPLVENCIKHDIEPGSRPGVVLVRTVRRDGKICILVNDDGLGMTALQLENYRALLRTDENSHTNIGVRNVARRLQLQFNGQCDFEVSSSPGKGVSVEIRIPEEWGERA